MKQDAMQDYYHAYRDAWHALQQQVDAFNMNAFLAQLHLQQRALLLAHQHVGLASAVPIENEWQTFLSDVSHWCNVKHLHCMPPLAMHEMANVVGVVVTHDDVRRLYCRRKRIRALVCSLCHDTLVSFFTQNNVDIAVEYISDLLLLAETEYVDIDEASELCNAILANVNLNGAFDVLKEACMRDKLRFAHMPALATDDEWLEWFESL